MSDWDTNFQLARILQFAAWTALGVLTLVLIGLVFLGLALAKAVQ